jgi:hypothetical protein
MASVKVEHHETIGADGLLGDDRAVALCAVRFVRTWGFTTVEMVAGRFRPARASTQTRTSMVRRALAHLPELRWLEPTCEWFTLLDCESPATATADKIAAVADALDRDELYAALDKKHTFRDVPPVVGQAYVSALLTRPRIPAEATLARLPREERALIGLLRDAGGASETELLRRQAEALSLDAATVRRTLQSSPLFLRAARGVYRLAGAPLGPTAPGTADPWSAMAFDQLPG